MRRTIKTWAAFLILIIFFFASCSGVKKFKINILPKAGIDNITLFDKEKLAPLKNEWKELYLLLKKGHLICSKSEQSISFVHSYQLYTLLRQNRVKVYSTPFLQDYENFLMTFGRPDNIQIVGDRIFIIYTRVVLDEPCETCLHDLFAFTFDKKSKRLLKE